MKRCTYIGFTFMVWIVMFHSYAQSYVTEYHDARLKVPPQIAIKSYPFSLKNVRLLDGPFKHALEMDRRWLLQLEPDRFLHRFHENAGLPVKGDIYEGWENTTQSGHTFGHYISALSMLYAATGDQEVKKRVDYIIDELGRCQDARATGYVGGIPNEDSIWTDIADGNIIVSPFDLNGLWVPWYNLHKLWAGLLDAYYYGENEKAKAIVIKLTDWTCDKFKDFTPQQWQKMLICESGGMFDVLMSVYALTGEERHLQLATHFYHQVVLDPLSEKRDELSGKHANTQIPKVVGAARAYQLTGDEKYRTIASFFWETVVNNHSYVTGGNSNYEHFGEPGQLSGRLSSNTTETCNTYNMLKLTRHLFAWTADARYADYYERALYNHILASQNPETGMVCYFVPLGAKSQKAYSTPDHSFWCCVGTGFENHVKYGEQIYTHKGDSLYVNLFIASELQWEDKAMLITQQTTYPEEGESKFIIKCPSNTKATFLIRYPGWVKSGYTIKVNGKKIPIRPSAGSYVPVEGNWNTGDSITVEMPFQLRQDALLGDSHKKAFVAGPLVLAGSLNETDKNPIFLNKNQPLEKWVKLSQGKYNTFTTKAGYPKDVLLTPFYKEYKGIYSVYFDNYTPKEWAVEKPIYEKQVAYEEDLVRRTVDYFRPNEQQQEIDHHFKGEHVNKGDRVDGRKWCDAANGWFSFEMKTMPDTALTLLLTYWGNDGGNRKFDILVDDQVIATEELTAAKNNQYIDVNYLVPESITRDKDKITIKLRAHKDNTAGGIFGARLLCGRK